MRAGPLARDNKRMKSILIIHGEKLKRDGKMRKEFKERLDKAIVLARDCDFDEIIISGGRTREGLPSEANVGATYLKGKTTLPIILENRARTTSENVRNTKTLLEEQGTEIEEITVITSKERIRRAKYLYKRLWPTIYPFAHFYPAKDYYWPTFKITELLYLLFNFLDPYEKTLAHFAKKYFRNAYS